MRTPALVASLLALAAAFGAARPAGAGGSMSCEQPPVVKGRRHGVARCYYDDAKKKVGQSTIWKDDKELETREFSEEDGTLSRISRMVPNGGGYASDERYYETGGIRSVEFTKPGSTIHVKYFVSGRIHSAYCTPCKDQLYCHSLKECQPLISFDLTKWRPAK